jgi:hypothetical protein
MLITRHPDGPYGKQSQALASMRAQGAEKLARPYRVLGSRPG